MGWNPTPKSRQISDPSLWGMPHGPPSPFEGEVATDGGCMDIFGGRAGWGLAFVCREAHHVSGALPGPWQTAQRAEVFAVLMALTLLSGPLVLLTDSRYVHDRIVRFLRGEKA